MTPTDPMAELAARCEAATGADRGLDALIWCAVFAPAGSYVERSRFNGEWCIYNGVDRKGEARLWEDRYHQRVQPVTASIDAAVMLVPEGALWKLTRLVNIGIGEIFQRPRGEPELVFAAGVGVGKAPATWTHSRSFVSPALALCSPALRSRATLAKGTDR
jgi:hypothetical protein